MTIKKRFLALALALAMLGALLAGCGPAAPETSSTEENGNEAIVLTDQAGREVTLEEPAERIVSAYYLSSSLLIALGLEDQVVGIEMKADTRELYKLAAPQFLDLPAVGSGKGINVEETAALEPDLVLLPMKLAEQAEQFDALDIPCIVIDPETLDGFWETVTLLGQATGTEEKAAELIGYQKDIMDDVEARCMLASSRPTVYIAGSDFLRTTPVGMYQDALINLCGGYNAAMALEGAEWADISMEELAAWNPDKIYMVSYAEYTRDDILNESQYRVLSAIENSEEDFLVFPSSIEPWDYPTASMALGALWLAYQLHPEIISEEEYVTEAQSFYRDFFGIEVSAETLLAH